MLIMIILNIILQRKKYIKLNLQFLGLMAYAFKERTVIFMKKYNVGIIGATGMVGRTFLKVLEERQFPFENIYFFSSKKSAGSTLTFAGKDYIVEELTETAFDGKDIQIALFSAGGATSAKFAPIAASKGIIVVDNSAQWRMDPDVPLIVPEVNPEALKDIKKGIIANPNCSTIQAMVPLKPLYENMYNQRHEKDEYYKHVLTNHIGCWQSEYCPDVSNAGKLAPYQFANLSKIAVNETRHLIEKYIVELRKAGRKVLLTNTDGIWYQGELFHDENEGSSLGQ